MRRDAAHRKTAGFTLVEAMIVVAILSILSAIGMVAYLDHQARAHVAEGIGLSSGARMAIAVYYGDHGTFPAGNLQAGLSAPGSIAGRHVGSVEIGNANGLVSIRFTTDASTKLQDQTLTMQVVDDGGSLRWRCAGIDTRYLPSTCR